MGPGSLHLFMIRSTVAVNARPYETQQVVPVMGLDFPES